MSWDSDQYISEFRYPPDDFSTSVSPRLTMPKMQLEKLPTSQQIFPHNMQLLAPALGNSADIISENFYFIIVLLVWILTTCWLVKKICRLERRIKKLKTTLNK